MLYSVRGTEATRQQTNYDHLSMIKHDACEETSVRGRSTFFIKINQIQVSGDHCVMHRSFELFTA